ncbi:MAG: UDP-N-acetylmuramoyl-L-alanyl-D-glutamate--2,6-diaminopimelate ligase [Bacteroidaceae bacterium]|nr:UDP-N-acetylmuramoyl-L-alanyl-D-glutamate--2,6-diaminopimelate ligase [Bacteroidaceae bacterium]
MKLDELIKGLPVVAVEGSLETEIANVQIDSRKVVEGSMFVAMRGTTADGHAFIDKAVELGAKVILCEEMPQNIQSGVTYIKVENCENCVGLVATRFYGNPSEKVKLVGVTGTNGKTTIATLLYEMFRKMGYKCGLLSTVCNYIDGEPIPASHTTPDAITLNALLGRMADEGCKYVFMECSSHAIAQKRIGGLKYAGGIFTNLTRDHLDYHKTVDNYIKAKKMFFDLLGKDAFMVTNLDDKHGLVMAQNTKAKVKTYSLRSMSDFKGKLLESGFDGMLMDINGQEVFLRFIGKFNASNLLAVYGTACMLGKAPVDVLTVMSTLIPVNGRFDALRSPEGYTAIVDYAHTPDALANVLTTITDVLAGTGQIITVVGAGGNRDKGKRPLMAQESVKYSDKVILTSDNPRFEEPQDIINDMLEGVSAQERKKVLVIVDRREAIRTACMLAAQNDVVLVAGKGHEDYQEIKGVKHHFDDKEIIKEIFESIN